MLNSPNLTAFNQDGLELIINTKTGEAFASVRAIARMMSTAEKGIQHVQIQRYAKSLIKSGTLLPPLESEIPTPAGLRSGTLYPEKAIREFAKKFNPELLNAFAEAGIRVFLHNLAGFQVQSNAIEQIKPKSALELAKEQVRLHEALELAAMQIKLLEEDNERQAEVIDELFDYSSIIRIAKFNVVDEKEFSWHKLKAASLALNLEIKKAPCPRYVTKNLYHHDVWRYCYPDFKMPETTTLVLQAR